MAGTVHQPSELDRPVPPGTATWRRRLRRRVLALAVATAAAAVGSSADLPWINAQPDDRRLPLPSSSVQTVLQDTEGFVWLGFYSAGLARYDGRELELYTTDDGLSDLTVRELLQDGTGHLWVASETGLAVSERPLQQLPATDRVRFRSELNGQPLLRTRIRHNWLAATPDGGVLVATAGAGLKTFHFAPDGSLVRGEIALPAAAGGGHDAVSALTVSRDGTIWVGLENGWLGHLEPGAAAFRPVALGGRPAPPATAFEVGPEGTLWIGTRDGRVWRLADVRAARPRFSVVSRLLGEQVESLLQEADGTLWVASLGAGVVRLDQQGERRLTRHDGLLSDTVWQIVQDREGTLWFPSNGGFSRLRADYRAFESYSGRPRGELPPTLPDPAAFSVLPGRPEEGVELWVGTGGGLVGIRGSAPSLVLDTAAGLASRSVYALERGPQGRIWIGTPAGLDVLGGGMPLAGLPPAAVHSTVQLGGRAVGLAEIPLDTVYSIAVSQLSPGAGGHEQLPVVCVAGTRGVTLMAGDSWFLLGPAAGVPASGATVCTVDSAGRLWVGSNDSGLLRSDAPITLAALEQLGGADGDVGREIGAPVVRPVLNRLLGGPSDIVHDLEPDGGSLWVGTAAGLIRLDAVTAEPDLQLDRVGGLGGDQAVAIDRDPTSGHLWVAQNEGLAEVEPVAGTVLRTVSRDDGLVDNEVWGPAAVAVDATGRVLLATPKGVTVYVPWLDLPNRVPPAVRLRRVTYHEDISGHNELAVSYAALTFTGAAGVRFRTRLTGWDESWSEPTDDTEFRFTNLPAYLMPASYRFEVVATNGDGVWSAAPAVFGFRVRPPWWLRWWAVLAAVGAIAAAAYGLDAVRTQRLVRRTRALEEEVARRTEQLRATARDLETLDRIVETVNREVQLERVMEALLQQGLRLVAGARRAAFLVRDPAGDRFAVAAVSGWEADLPPGGTVAADQAQRRFTAGAVELADGVFLAHRLKDRSGTTILEHLEASETLLTVNLTVEGRVQGFLVFELDPQQPAPGSDVRRLQRYRQHAISALDKARIVRELEQTSLEAARANRAKSAFLATMSHELRTPLNSIIGFSELVLAKLGDGEPRIHRFVSNILTSGRQLLAMINDILDLSKIEAGRMELEPETVDLAVVLESVTRIMVGIAGSRGIEILSSVAPDVPPISADVPKLKHILFNLLSNAVKFSPDDSRVHVAADLLDSTSSPLKRPTVRIEVADRGIGIPPAEQERIFEEFHQIESGASRRFVGSGLGLALVRSYTELHGGSVAVAPAEDGGSIFTVLLPVARD